MKDQDLERRNRILGKDLIKYFILIYWILFWLFNVMDKIIGGAHFLFVGKDRFAQIERFFDSVGLGSPIIANVALIITAGLEIFACVFYAGALYHFKNKNDEATRSWFFVGIALTLSTFIYFSIGDQIFGDHFELLEHALFILISLLSWMVFVRLDHLQRFDDFSIPKTQYIRATLLAIGVTVMTVFSIFRHHHTSFIERTQAVSAVKIAEDKYSIKFPFLAGSKAFEHSIAKFKEDHPDAVINYIYTAPSPMRLGESDGLIIYIQTENRQ